MQAWAKGFTTLLWCDASILPIKPLTPLWNRIESDGYWISRNGWTNYEWTADSAYPELFPTIFDGRLTEELALQRAREVNKQIPHVVATTFGVSMEHEVGREFLQEYLKLANGSAFNGPWTNSVTTRCGSQEVLGHRHDQTAASVIAWRLGCALTNPPEYFAYSGGQIDKTILLADGAY
jgi:hypothetical protein